MSDDPTPPGGGEQPVDPSRAETSAVPADWVPPPAPPPLPERFGRYRIIRLIGQGGMGSVYEAEQDRPQRIVALKVIKAGSVSEAALRRFDLESRLLGKLQHPGIAQIYEAGTADSGSGPQPYFVMEFIRGKTLLESVEAARPSLHQKLELMARVCDAVHHAHQKGVIHRDLKPGNILVDETGQPKVLDFGVARATDSDTQATTQTDVGDLLGTLQYMSPEQVLAEPSEIDTRSDVYALGVIMYQLLAGRLPYDTSRRSLPEALRMVREEDPAPLGTINRALRGDVETIVGKALEKERDRRYGSAAELAADIRHDLADEPIMARPPSAAYQMRKFARRNRPVVFGAAAVVFALVAGIVATGSQAVKTRREALKAQAVNQFLQEMLQAANPRSLSREDPDRGRTVTVVQVLGDAVRRLDAGTLDKQPLVEAAVRRTIGVTYRDLGDYGNAEPNLRRSLEIREERLGKNHLEVAESLSELGELAYVQGKSEVAEPQIRRALGIRIARLGPDDPLVARSLVDLGEVLQELGNSGAADSLFRRALIIDSRAAADPVETARTLHNLALIAQERGNLAEADSLFTRTLAIRRNTLTPDHPDVASTLHSLAVLEKKEGKMDEAERSMREALEIWRRILGDRHPYVATTLVNLGGMLRDRGRLSEAEPLIREAVDIQRSVLAPDDPQLAGTLYNLARLLQAQGKPGEAEPLIREALAIERKSLPADHPAVLAMMAGLGSVLTDTGRAREAETILREVNTAFPRVLPPGDWQLSQVKSLLGASILAQGRYAEAESLLLSGYGGLSSKAAVPLDRKQKAVERIVRLYEEWTANLPNRSRSTDLAAWRDTLAVLKQ